MNLSRHWPPRLLLLLAMLLTTLAYWPGLSGDWLVDDKPNLDGFTHFAAGAAPYRELIFGNNSGMLGRSVSMATFAANHALNLFSIPALKATNLLVHLLCGILLYVLLSRLFRRRSPVNGKVSPKLSAAVFTAWWLLLPLNISTVLYIVQRMTQMAALLSLASCIAYVHGRENLEMGRRAGIGWIAFSLLVLLPLALLAKESALSTVPWLILIEIFFFQENGKGNLQPRRLLAIVVAFVVLAGALIAWQPPRFVADGYLTRDFTLGERLLSEPRALWTYIGDIFLPDSSRMGLFHDDFAVSTSLLSPWTTLPATVLLAALLGIALLLAQSRRWWAVSFGIMLYLSGHLLESSLLPLELFFEHRNYLPSIGLLLAATPALAAIPMRSAALAALLTLYFGLLSFATSQRSHIWGDPHLLLALSAYNHPHSVRAWSDYAEDLLSLHHPDQALQAVALTARRNPDFSGISYLHMLTIVCRLNSTPPQALIDEAGNRLADIDATYSTSLSVGLDSLLDLHLGDHCKKADFSPLAPGLIAQDKHLVAQLGQARGRRWLARYNIAQWLIELDHAKEARDILRDIWQHQAHTETQVVGLALAKTLAGEENTRERERTIAELEAVTADAPPEFRRQMNALHHSQTGAL